MRGPPWIKDFSAGNPWLYRIPVLADTTGLTGSTAYTGQLTIPEPFDLFWDNVETDFRDLRVTTFDGRTAVPFDHSNNGTLSASGRSGVLLVRPTITTATVMEVYWLYWGNSAATDTGATITSATDIDFYISPETPVPPIVSMESPEPGTTNGTVIQRDSSAETFVYYRLPTASDIRGRIGGRPGYEAPQDLNVTPPAGYTADKTDIRLLQDRNRNLYARVRCSGGTSSDTDQALILTVNTILGQVLIGTASLTIQDLT